MEISTSMIISIVGIIVSAAGLAWGIISFLLKRINSVNEQLGTELETVRSDNKETNKRISDLVENHLTNK